MLELDTEYREEKLFETDRPADGERLLDADTICDGVLDEVFEFEGDPGEDKDSEMLLDTSRDGVFCIVRDLRRKLSVRSYVTVEERDDESAVSVSFVTELEALDKDVDKVIFSDGDIITEVEKVFEPQETDADPDRNLLFETDDDEPMESDAESSFEIVS